MRFGSPGFPPSLPTNQSLRLGRPSRACTKAQLQLLPEKVPPPPPCSQQLGEAALGGTGGRGRGGEGEASPPTRDAALSTLPLGSAPIASQTTNGGKPRRQMTRKYVTGARRTALGAGSVAGSKAPSIAPRLAGGPSREEVYVAAW